MFHYILYAIILMNLASVVTVIFFERKNPASSMAWILLLTFVPVFGFFLYLFLGSGFRFRKRKIFARKSSRDDHYDDRLLRQLRTRNRHLVDPLQDVRFRLMQYLERESEGCFNDDIRVEVLIDGF